VGLPLRPRVFATLALAQVFILAFASTAALAPSGAEALGPATALTMVSGDVVVGHAGQEPAAGAVGDVLAPGDTVRTGPGATAEITYFEGSSVRLEAGTELVIEALTTEADGGTVIAVAQAIGRTWHVVTKLLTLGSRYEVRTPTSAASVRGTIFAVDVRDEGDGAVATVTTLEGAVVHGAPDPARPGAMTDVRVNAGQESTNARGKPAGPAHRASPSKLSGAPKRPAAIARPPQHAVGATPHATNGRNVRLPDERRALPTTKHRERGKSRHRSRA